MKGFTMKILIKLLFLFILIGCDAEFLEKDSETIEQQNNRVDNIAQITCSKLNHTGTDDSFLRIDEINKARFDMGIEPYLGSDELIKKSISFNLCTKLVKNNPNIEKLIQDKESDFLSQTCNDLDIIYLDPSEYKHDDYHKLTEYTQRGYNHVLKEHFDIQRFDIKLQKKCGDTHRRYFDQICLPIELINNKKIEILNKARKKLLKDPFKGSANVINKHQFFGVCEKLVNDEPSNIDELENLLEYNRVKLLDDGFGQSSSILVSNGTRYLEFRSSNQYLLNLENFKIISNLDFQGYEIFTDENNFTLKKIRVEFSLKDSKFQNTYRTYYLNGDLRSEVYYIDGKKHGLARTWYIGNQLRTSLNWINGQPDGIPQCFQNGKEVDLEECK